METQQREVQQEIKQEIIEQEEVKPIKEEVIHRDSQIPKQKTKISNLVACPNCNRYMKQNTLDFHHAKICKARSEEYIPKALKNSQLKAQNIKHIVKEAINIIENEKTKKIEKPPQTTSNDQKQTTAPVRTTSQPPVRKLETIQERIPTYNDLRREKMERKVNVLNSFKLF